MSAHLDYIKATTSLLGGHDVKDVTKLEQGDHLYVYMKGIKSGFRHHGVVYFVPKNIELLVADQVYQQIIIVEMNREGIRKVSLHKFCYERKKKPKYVVYGVSEYYRSVAMAGTCQTEKPLDVISIMKRCDILLKELAPKKLEDNDVLKYSLINSNCEDFAIWCTLATTSALFCPQVVDLLKKKITVAKQAGKLIQPLVHTVKHHEKFVDIFHSVAHAFKHSGTTTSQLSVSTATVTADTVKTMATSSAKAVSTGITGSVAVGVEIIFDTARVIRSKNDINYTKDDAKMDILKSSSTTALVVGSTAVVTFFCASNPIGWAIGTGIGVSLICTGFWLWYKSKYGKNWKQKMYREFSDKNEFTKKEDFKNIKKLNKLRRKLNQYIKDFKLHPDRWSEKDREEMKKHKEWLNDPKWYKRWWHKLQNSVSCTFKDEEELIKSYKTKEEKIKVFFLFESIKTQIYKDIVDIKNGTYDENNGKKKKKDKNKQILAIENKSYS